MVYSFLQPLEIAMRYCFNRNQLPWILTFAVLMGCVGCGDKSVSTVDRSLRVRAITVTLGPYSRKASLTGEFRARYQSDLAFRVGGRIATRNVDVGDHVAAGDVLAVLDTQEQKSDIEVAKATLRSAEAMLK